MIIVRARDFRARARILSSLPFCFTLFRIIIFRAGQGTPRQRRAALYCFKCFPLPLFFDIMVSSSNPRKGNYEKDHCSCP